MTVELTHKRVGDQHLITSPQVPELHVARTTRDDALKAVPGAMKLIDKMKAKQETRRQS